jgi:hypothetical protein
VAQLHWQDSRLQSDNCLVKILVGWLCICVAVMF